MPGAGVRGRELTLPGKVGGMVGSGRERWVRGAIIKSNSGSSTGTDGEGPGGGETLVWV